MRSLSENQFHALMGVLVVGSLFLDRILRGALPAWDPPTVSLITFALGLIWVGLFAAHRLQGAGDRYKVLEDRIERLQVRVGVLEDAERERRGLPRAMARLELRLPDRFPFSTEIEVRVTDLNYGAHLGNDAMLGILHEARVRFLRAHGMSESDVGGTALIMADAAVVYRTEAFGGDRLRVEVALGEFARVGCDMFYRVTREQDGKLVAEAKTGLVFLDPERRRPTRIPEALRRLGDV